MFSIGAGSSFGWRLSEYTLASDLTRTSIFVFEFVSGGGLISRPQAPLPAGSMLYEGQAMARALIQDFRSAGHDVVTTRDARIPEDSDLSPHVTTIRIDSPETWQAALRTAAERCEFGVIIAPETDQLLPDICQQVRRHGIRLVQSDDGFTRLVADKHATAAWLYASGVRTTSGVLSHGPPRTMPDLPVVVKPVTGAGCDDSYVVRSRSAWDAVPWLDRAYRIEAWIDGTPASVALLMGPQSSVVLAPCLQHLDDEFRLRYLGGTVLDSDGRAMRVRRLAQRVCPLLVARGRAVTWGSI